MIDFRMFIVIEAQIEGVVGVVCDYYVGCRSCANLDKDWEIAIKYQTSEWCKHTLYRLVT